MRDYNWATYNNRFMLWLNENEALYSVNVLLMSTSSYITNIGSCVINVVIHISNIIIVVLSNFTWFWNTELSEEDNTAKEYYMKCWSPASKMSQRVGRFDHFDVHNDNWLEYWEAPKMTASVITIIGKDAFSLLQTLVSHKKPSSMKVGELNDAFTAHFQPNPIVIAERYKFYKWEQRSGEVITNYIAELRKLTL